MTEYEVKDNDTYEPLRQKLGKLLGIIGLYNAYSKSIKVIVCPENPALVGLTLPVVESKQNINSSMSYSLKTGKNLQTALEQMDYCCGMARKDPSGPMPETFFFLPSANYYDGTIHINSNPISCRSPMVDKNSNILYPVYGYIGVHIFILNIVIGKTTKTNRKYDQVTYFVTKNFPIHEGYLCDELFLNKILANCAENDFTKIINPNTGVPVIATDESVRESVKYQFCLKNHPEICLYSSVSTLYNPDTQSTVNTILDLQNFFTRIISGLTCKKIDDEDVINYIKRNILIRCQFGYTISDVFFTSDSGENSYDRRFRIPVYEHCSRRFGLRRMAPLKRVPNEDKRLLRTARSLSLLTEDKKNVIFPEGEGILVINKKVNPNTQEEKLTFLVDAGFLPHEGSDIPGVCAMPGTKVNLNQLNISYQKIFSLILSRKVQNAVSECLKGL